MSPRSNQKPSLGQRSTLEKHVTSMSCRLEPAIWSQDTGQQIPYFDRCQLIITWMSDIKEVNGKPRLHVSVNLLLEYGRHVARLHHRRRRRRRRRRRAYAPTSNTASHGTHEKIISWVPFSSLIWVWGSAWRPSAAGAPLLTLSSALSTVSGLNSSQLGFSIIVLSAFLVEVCAFIFCLHVCLPGRLSVASWTSNQRS